MNLGSGVPGTPWEKLNAKQVSGIIIFEEIIKSIFVY